MPKIARSPAAFCILTLFAGFAAAQQPQPPAQQPVPVPLGHSPDDQIVTFHANARAVLLDVVVTDGHGHAIHGLKPEDFHIAEDGQPQTVASLEERKPLTPEEFAAQPRYRDLPPNTFSNRKPPLAQSATTVFLLDALDSSVQAQMYAREQLLGWVKTMQPGTMVAVFQLDTQLSLIQGFTSDPAVLQTAIKDRYKPTLSAIPKGEGYVTAASQMAVLTQALQNLGSYLATRPGRKNLVWFTTHVPRSSYDSGTYLGGSLHDSESFLFDYSKATDALVLGEVSVYPIDTRGLMTNPAMNAENGRRPGRNSDTNFGTRQFIQHTDLDEVAEATGGRAFYNTNGIKEAVSEVIETSSSFYTLSYYPTNKKWDGTYRKLKLETDRPGVTLEYRRGYYAQAQARPEPRLVAGAKGPTRLPDGRVQLTNHAASADEATFVRSMHLGAVDPGQIIFLVHADIDPAIHKLAKNEPLPKNNYLAEKYRDKPYRTFNVICVIPGSQLQLDPEHDNLHHGSIEINAVLVDDKDQLVNSINNQLQMDLKTDTYQLILTKGLDMPIPLAVPEKGTFFLRVGVHDVASGKSGVIEMNTSDIKLEPPLAPSPPAKP